MRPDVLANHLANQIKALEAARDVRDARRDATVVTLQKQVQDLQYTVSQLRRDLILLESQRKPSR